MRHQNAVPAMDALLALATAAGRTSTLEQVAAQLWHFSVAQKMGVSNGRMCPLSWLFVVAFNLVGMVELIVEYCHASQVGLPALAGQLGATYVIPVIHVPVLMIRHVVPFYLLLRPPPKPAPALAGDAAAS